MRGRCPVTNRFVPFILRFWASRPNPRRVENRPATHPLYGVIS